MEGRTALKKLDESEVDERLKSSLNTDWDKNMNNSVLGRIVAIEDIHTQKVSGMSSGQVIILNNSRNVLAPATSHTAVKAGQSPRHHARVSSASL